MSPELSPFALPLAHQEGRRRSQVLVGVAEAEANLSEEKLLQVDVTDGGKVREEESGPFLLAAPLGGKHLLILTQPVHPLLARSFSAKTRRSSQVSSIFNFRLRSRGSEGEMADDEYSIPEDVIEGVGGGTYSGGTFSGILSHPWPKRRPSTYSTTSRSSQVVQPWLNVTETKITNRDARSSDKEL